MQNTQFDTALGQTEKTIYRVFSMRNGRIFDHYQGEDLNAARQIYADLNVNNSDKYLRRL